MPIDTEALARKYRAATIDVPNKRLLVTNFRGTEQEKDLTEPANCDGFGRIRHFCKATSSGWPSNPLPIEPACRALRLGPQDEIRAQVFQNAACNWRCWYCFVPFNLLSADQAHSAWLTPSELFQLFLAQPNRPLVLDLSGGQPELTPEWVYWMIEEIENNGLGGQIYLEIQTFTPVLERLDSIRLETFDNQRRAVEAWQRELDRRFPASVRDLPITQIPMGRLAHKRDA